MKHVKIIAVVMIVIAMTVGGAYAQTAPTKEREVTVKVENSEDGTIEIEIENDGNLSKEEAKKIRKESEAIIKAKTKELKIAIEKIRADFDAGKITEAEMGQQISVKAEAMSKEIEKEAARLEAAVKREVEASMSAAARAEAAAELAEAEAEAAEEAAEAAAEAAEEALEEADEAIEGSAPRISMDEDGNDRKITINTKMKPRKKRRTYTGIALAFGWHTMLNDVTAGETIYPEMDFWKGGFTQIDFMLNTRIGGNRSPIWLNYGVGLLYQKVDVAGNNILSHTTEPLFVQAPGAITSNKFRNQYVTGTLGLKIAPKGNDGFYIEMNGFAGARFRTKQNFEYVSVNGEDVVEKRTDRYGVNKFNYGASAAIGYKMCSVYARYDMSSLFENTSRYDYHPLSVGVKLNLF